MTKTKLQAEIRKRNRTMMPTEEAVRWFVSYRRATQIISDTVRGLAERLMVDDISMTNDAVILNYIEANDDDTIIGELDEFYGKTIPK